MDFLGNNTMKAKDSREKSVSFKYFSKLKSSLKASIHIYTKGD